MIYRDRNMGSPPRSWEHSDDIMEVDNIYSDFFARENIRDNIAVIFNNGKNSYMFYILIIVTYHYDLLGDVPDVVAQGLRIASQILVDNPSPRHMFSFDPPPQRFGSDPPPQRFGSDPPPQNEVNEPLNLVNRVRLIHPVDPVDAVQYDETSSNSIVCFMFYIIHNIINKVY